MFEKNILWAGLTALVLSLITASPAMPNSLSQEPKQFQAIKQPLPLKVGVTIAGVGLIGLELWWFLFSQSPGQTKSQQD
ncbi:hypothetical protein NWP17_11705 [Chrysosporum bergii ANA360D]|jgi:plastocyanin domain-containing protein|uniref:Uncharacterized protein n=1 Tax=Chrysosporum bergii ANA360D TaxID=617107 RepID=A0AA43KCI8_9CYAN|nr:hypothetical protein [Chrysosporum bergii]MDH6061095.1 hypothetical protein [Chrysosporum bergii ANA360D]